MTPHLVSATRVAFQHTKAIRENGVGTPTLGMLGVKSFMYTTGAIPGQDMLKLGIYNSGNTGQFFVDTPSVAQDFSWVKGAHTFAFGGSWTRPSSDGDGPFQADGQFTFDGLMTSGTAQTSGGYNLADFLLGYPSAHIQGGSQINNEYVHAIGTYANDVWRLNSRITLNYGVRWEPFLAPRDRNGFTTGFIRENFDKGIHSVAYPNAPAGLIFAGDPGFPTNNANSNNQLQADRSPSGVRPRSGRRRQADHPHWFRHLLRFAEVVDHGASHAERAVRQYRVSAAARLVSRTAEQEWLPDRFPESVELDARRRSACRDQLSAHGGTGPAADAQRTIPDERGVRQHAGRLTPDAVVPVQRVAPARSGARLAARRHLYWQSAAPHLDWRLRGKSGCLHPRQLRRGAVRVDGSGAVFEYERGQPAGARRSFARQSGRRREIQCQCRG